MKANAILCAAVVCSLVAAGCSKSEKKPGEDKLAKPPTGGGGPSEAPAVAWGGAVKGLQAGLEVKQQAGFGAPFGVEIRVRNVGEKRLKLYDAGHDSSWHIVFTPEGDGTPRRAGRFNRWARETRIPSNVDLAKGAENVTLRCNIAGAQWQFADAKAAGYEAVRRTSINTLPSGRYTVTAAYSRVIKGPVGRDLRADWQGTVTTGAVEIEIAAKGGAARAIAGPPPSPVRSIPTTKIQKGKRRQYFLDWDFCTDNSNNSAVDRSALKKGRVYFVGFFDERGWIKELRYHDREWRHRWTKRFSYGPHPSEAGRYVPHTYEYLTPDGEKFDHAKQERIVKLRGGWKEGTRKERIRKSLGEPLVIATDPFGMEKWRFYDGVSQHWYTFNADGKLDYSNYEE